MSDTVNITTQTNSVSIDTPTDNSNVAFSNKGFPELVVESDETKTIDSGEILTRSLVTVDGKLIIDGKLETKQ